MGTYVQKGYGQVEPNRIQALASGPIEAQAPALTSNQVGASPIAELQNGQFLNIVQSGHVKSPMGRCAVYPTTGNSLWMVYSEKKLYDEREGYADFVDRAADKVDGYLYPRLLRVEDGDVFTTNLVVSTPTSTAAISLAIGNVLKVNSTWGGMLSLDGNINDYTFTVTKVYTMPDGQPGVKLLVKKVDLTQ